ncbi:hypothetical protein [Bdellovibrio sp. HCB-110]|uniref:hypothetical protein n=1 Tax=Bdellovibrio sp. HCB-110 TaxID=3391182 RepID=UPI0039B40BBB
MKFKPYQIVTIVLTPVILFGFQNCSKVGTNGIAVDDKALSLEAIEVLEPMTPVAEDEPSVQPEQSEVVDNEEPAVSSPPPTPTQPGHSKDPKEEEPEESEIVDNGNTNTNTDSQPPSQIEDPEILDAIASCDKSADNVQTASDLGLSFNHESIEANADTVSFLKGNYGTPVIIRAQQESSTAKSIHVNHTTLVMCKFATLENIKGSQNRIIIVGGEVKSAHLNNSMLTLVNAKSTEVKGANTIIKEYSFK